MPASTSAQEWKTCNSHVPTAPFVDGEGHDFYPNTDLRRYPCCRHEKVIDSGKFKKIPIFTEGPNSPYVVHLTEQFSAHPNPEFCRTCHHYLPDGSK